jgi:hypothetical protein
VTGLEPATSAVTGQRSNLLSYTPAGATDAIIGPYTCGVTSPVDREDRPGSTTCVVGPHPRRAIVAIRLSIEASGQPLAALAGHVPSDSLTA